MDIQLEKGERVRVYNTQINVYQNVHYMYITIQLCICIYYIFNYLYTITQLYNIIYTQKLHSSKGTTWDQLRTPMASETPTRSATFNNAA